MTLSGEERDIVCESKSLKKNCEGAITADLFFIVNCVCFKPIISN